MLFNNKNNESLDTNLTLDMSQKVHSTDNWDDQMKELIDEGNMRIWFEALQHNILLTVLHECPVEWVTHLAQRLLIISDRYSFIFCSKINKIYRPIESTVLKDMACHHFEQLIWFKLYQFLIGWYKLWAHLI